MVNNYESNDYVYIFGFSRGAAAARSLSGVKELIGILPKTTMDQFPAAWRYYNQQPRDLSALARSSPTLAVIAKRGEELRVRHQRECEEPGEQSESEFFEPFDQDHQGADAARFEPE